MEVANDHAEVEEEEEFEDDEDFADDEHKVTLLVPAWPAGGAPPRGGRGSTLLSPPH